MRLRRKKEFRFTDPWGPDNPVASVTIRWKNGHEATVEGENIKASVDEGGWSLGYTPPGRVMRLEP